MRFLVDTFIVDSWLEQHSDLRRKVIKDDYFHTLESNPQTRYNMLKRQLHDIVQLMGQETLNLSSEDIQRLANLVTAKDQPTFQKGVVDILDSDKQKQTLTKAVWKIFKWGAGVSTGVQTRRQATLALQSQDDPSFAQSLEVLIADQPQFYPAIKEITTEITKLLRWKIQTLSQSLPAALERGLKDKIDESIRLKFEDRRKEEEEDAWKSLRVQVEQALATATKRNGSAPPFIYSLSQLTLRLTSPKFTIDSVSCESLKHHGYRKLHPTAPLFHIDSPIAETFHIKGTRSAPTTAGFEYLIRPIHIKADDMHAISSNPDHICKPVVRTHSAQAITLPVTADVRYALLL
jgi:phage FluMu protein gp41